MGWALFPDWALLFPVSSWAMVPRKEICLMSDFLAWEPNLKSSRCGKLEKRSSTDSYTRRCKHACMHVCLCIGGNMQRHEQSIYTGLHTCTHYYACIYVRLHTHTHTQTWNIQLCSWICLMSLHFFPLPSCYLFFLSVSGWLIHYVAQAGLTLVKLLLPLTPAFWCVSQD